jgi:hypothetical protein
MYFHKKPFRTCSNHFNYDHARKAEGVRETRSGLEDVLGLGHGWPEIRHVQSELGARITR